MRHSADLARSNVDILVLDCSDDVARHELEALQLVRIDPHTHRILRTENVDVADPGDPRQVVLDVGCEPVRNIDVGCLVGRIVDADDHQEVGRALRHCHALLLNNLRQAGDRRLDLILDLHLSDVGRDGLVEHRGNRDRAARTRGRAEIEQAVEPRQRLLDDLRDAAFERRRGGARIGCADIDLGRRDVGILRDGKREDRADSA